ncbi:DUF4922 domain-containing protein [Motiliproteus sediminis]|uniref:DUF4922 domain-containing protein n=1 Tax=Motiliproteus sediminis TaxID=1468178 RepID=UPI001AEF7828|nr:DUF4922 domain-containing protein [Motiliproteus sediminis]
MTIGVLAIWRMGANPSSVDLWSRAAAVSRQALEAGALLPVATRLSRWREKGVSFQLRSLSAQPAKPVSQASGNNPFLPYDRQLLVGEVGTAHLLLLNKFPVVPDHLLLLTRQFQSQTAALTEADFVAASELLASADGLLFFNAGIAAGASQPHRHMQLIPSPAPDVDDGFPLAPGLLAGDLPWLSLCRRFDALPDARARGRGWHRFYREALTLLGLGRSDQDPLQPYNLLICRRFMAVIPRSVGRVDGFSVNALGYAGMMLVKDETDAERLQQRSITSVLTACGVTR